MFGTAASVVTIYDGYHGACIAPPSPIGRVIFVIRYVESGMISNSLQFTYLEQLLVYDVTPNKGIFTGGTAVTVTGRNFVDSSNLVCRFGSINVQASYINSSRISCVTPKQDPGVVRFAVSNNGDDLSAAVLKFTFIESCEINQIIPSRGPITGGTRLKLLGSGFEVNNTYCRIAFMPPVIINAEVASDTTSFCVSPEASKPGEYDVEVSIGGVAFSASKVKFQYVMGPVVSNIFPQRFASSGGTTLKIVGSNFVESSSTMCRFRSEQTSRSYLVSANYRDSRYVECKTPVMVFGAYTLALTTNGYDFVTSPVTVDVYVDPNIVAILPQYGPASGGTQINVYGKGFSSRSPTCRFGGVVVSAIYVSEKHVICISPAQSMKETVTLSVSMNSVDFVTSSGIVFTYTEIPSIIKISPTTGYTRGHIYKC